MKKTFTKLVALNITLVMLLTMLIPAVAAADLIPSDDPGFVKAKEGAGYYKVTIADNVDFELYDLYMIEFEICSFSTIAFRTHYVKSETEITPLREGVENGRRYAVYQLKDKEELKLSSLPENERSDINDLYEEFRKDVDNEYTNPDKSDWWSKSDYYTGVNYSCTHEVYSVEKVEFTPFTDVPLDSFYNAPVAWALERGITTGTSATTFSPDEPCTRAQVVTFLWRAKGEPIPKSSSNPFKDVAKDSWYTTAVLWAVGEGITNGTSATTFSPDEPCTRAQVVTFLMRALEKKEPNGSNWGSGYDNDLPELGGLKAYGTGYGISNYQYAPKFSSVTAYDQNGKALPDPVEAYGFYTKYPIGKATELKTAPQIGTTYYSVFTIDLDNIGSWDYEAEDIVIRIPGFICEFDYAMSREMGSYTTIYYTATAAPQFKDVPVDQYYFDPVHWAASKGITTGTGDGVFSPEDTCNRGQIVTFLYRALK